jgi:REP element-mobilizing transposase RayT
VPRRRLRVRQHELVFSNWGGARPGAGRKPKGTRAGVSHRRREALASRFPVHANARVRAGLPSLRCDAARRALERAFAAGRERFGFRLIHYSIQTNHVHFVVEATDARALSRGMQGLLVRVARALNRLWGRRGSVFADRYHARILRTPREVRNALAYVVLNAQKHGIRVQGIDPYSSGAVFDGWRDGGSATGNWKPRDAAESDDTLERVRETHLPVTLARTWLLRIGWRRWGLVRIDEVPRG